MSRTQHTLLILGCAALLWLESPRAWNVFAADLGRAIEPEIALGKRPTEVPRPIALAHLASLPSVLFGARPSALLAVTAETVADAR